MKAGIRAFHRVRGPSAAGGALTLPAAPGAVQQARAFLRAELAAHLDDDAAGVAVLLASELVTNAVVHAASELDVLWEADGSCVTVAVRDADTGPLTRRPGSGAELVEGGRGLLIVDQLSQAWGTEHDGGRKTVWFRLAAARASPDPDGGTGERMPGPARPASFDPVPGRAQGGMRALMLPELVQQALPFDQHVAEVLARVMDAAGAAGGEVRTTAGQVLARYGVAGPGGRSYPLRLGGRTLGGLVVHFATASGPDAESESFLRIAADRLSLLAYEHSVLRAGDGRAEEQDFLAQATELLTTTLSTRTSLTVLTQLVVPRLGDWCVAYAADERRRLTRVAANHLREDAIGTLTGQLDRDPAVAAALRQAAESGRAVRLPGRPQRDPAVVQPLTSRTRILGVVLAGRPAPIEGAAAVSLAELGRRAALAADNARLHEEQAHAAETLQRALLPPALPGLDGVDLAARYHSASAGLVVGGDFYDAFLLEDGDLICAIGDACGKGAEAASVTGTARDVIRLLLRDGWGLSDTLQRLNRALLLDAATSRFCTLALVRITGPVAGQLPQRDLRAVICLAGHPEPVVLRANGETEVAGVPGDLLGVLPGEIALTEQEVLLHPGDALVLYTDGVSERRDGSSMFGLAGIRRVLGGKVSGSAAALALTLEGAARSFADSELRDDLAILVARHSPGPAER
jgi:serine phosphatase RsbU (regulator of sigma subunit)/anti-sigma regulatory factor (Ser/Thr protein kinase)